MFLVDTNIFLEILLGQDKKEDCKKFLNNNIENLNITDFSLHSIGVFSDMAKRVFSRNLLKISYLISAFFHCRWNCIEILQLTGKT